METTPVYRYITPSRAAMIALMVWAIVASSNLTARAQNVEQSEPQDASSQRLRLPARASQADLSQGRSAVTSSRLFSTTISLGLIVVTILAAGRWLKRTGFGGVQSLPVEAFEILGKRVIEPRVAVHLVRCGSRVLVLSVGSGGVRTLSEIDDPVEVERLTAACQRPHEFVQEPNDTLANLAPIPRAAIAAPTIPADSRSRLHRLFLGLFAAAFLVLNVTTVQAQASRRGESANQVKMKDGDPFQEEARPRIARPAANDLEIPLPVEAKQFLSPQQLGLSLKMLALMTVVSLVPSILMMTTCFVRFTVVLGLLRQALGTPQGPPNQVLSAICLFLTILVMSPVWLRSYHEGIRPYTNPEPGEPAIDETTALTRTVAPVRTFMSQQIEKAGNSGIVWMLHDFQKHGSKIATATEPESYDDVSLAALTPAYLLSELKVAFLIGFQLFLPFLVIDLVVAAVLVSLGMTTMSPSIVSLPFKLLLFVLIDGWFLTVGMLLESVKVA